MLTQRWLTERQVDVITGYSVSKLQKDRFYRRGIPYVKHSTSRAVRYALSDVEAHMKSGRIDPKENENGPQ